MRKRHVFLICGIAVAAGVMPMLAGQGVPGPTVPTGGVVTPPPAPAPATGRQGGTAVPGGVATDPANPRPNQPNFIGFERPAPPMNIPAGFTPLFNGENLAGWHVSPINHHGHTPDFHVQQGLIVGTQMPLGGGGILLTDRKFKNFELYMEVKPDWGCDSGLFFRSTEWGAAYQVTMDYLPGGGIGAVICEGGMQGCGRAGGAGAAPAARGQTPGGPAPPGGAAANAQPGGAARGAGPRGAGTPTIVPGIALGGADSGWRKPLDESLET